MSRSKNLAVIGLFGFVIAAISSEAPARAGEPGAANRVAAIVDYIGADYAGAVHGGKIVSLQEYGEQVGLAKDARECAASLIANEKGAALAAALDELQRAMARIANENEVAALCRAVHARLESDFGLVLTPTRRPDLARATQLFAVGCAACHGPDGRAQSASAKALTPPPLSFHDDEKMARLSPMIAYHALTYGIKDTAMASFASLSDADRWSLAFYVLSLRHADADVARGAAAVKSANVPTLLSVLAQSSDGELDVALQKAVSDETTRRSALGYLRKTAPFIAENGLFDDARALLLTLRTNADDFEKDRQLAIAAYLEGVEPHEAGLTTKDPKWVARIETSFLDLRRAITEKDAAAVREQALRTLLVLDDIEERSKAGARLPFVAALAIALREGFEISLLVAALLAFVRKSGHGKLVPWVHAGWLVAIPAGIATWFVVGVALSGARRELTEAALTLIAATMLLFVSHLVFGRSEARSWLKFLERQTKSATAGLMLLAIAFIAAYREAIEIVLFFRALVLDSPTGAWSIVAGATTGIASLALIVFVMGQLGKRLNPRPVMFVSGILLTVLAISLVGQGVRALQEGGYVSVTALSFVPRISLLGIFPTLQGVGVQLFYLALVLVPLWLQKRRAPAIAAQSLAPNSPNR